jgi:methyl-accepting chemotaxis protein
MFRLKNWSVGLKLGLLAGAPLLILLLVATYNYFSSSRVNANFINTYENFSRPAMYLNEARANVQATQKNVLKMILTDDPRELREIDSDSSDRRRENESIYEEYEKTEIEDEEQRIYDGVSVLKLRFRDTQDECIRLAKENRRDEAIRLFFDTLDPIAVEYNAAVVDLASHMVKVTEDSQAATAKNAGESSLAVAVITAVAAAVMIFLSVLVVVGVTRPVNSMRKKIGLFAGGDLSVDFSDDGRDAISQMSNALEDMVVTLRGVVESINGASEQISSSSEDFSAMAQETNATVMEFRNSIDEMGGNLDALSSASEEVTASVEEVAAGAQTTAEKGTDIARRVDDAMKAGDKGINAVRSVVGGVGRVTESSVAATDAVVQLGDRARQIQNFVAQIGGIADQTNLLALNAAIEAARAGDAGRGFAVVAEEVRKLAEDSNVAAKNIADLAGTITSEIDTIVTLSQQNATESNSARELSSQTEAEINNMIDYLREIAHATQDLAAVAQEQAASSEEIAESVQGMSGKINGSAKASESIRDGVTEVASASDRVSRGAEQLASLSGELQSELAFFRVDNGGGRKGSAKKDGITRALLAGKR